MEDFQNIYTLYTSAKTNRERYKPLWDRIAQFVGINVQPNYLWNNNQSTKSTQFDQYVDDPTSAISVNQFGDYLLGIMWGTGDQAFSVVPSRYVEELVEVQTLKDYYSFVTDQVLYHMNHSDAGLNNALRPYAYDQAAFGTSGVGTFPNQDFKDRISENALMFRNYGVDNMAIDEGKAGCVDIVFVVYHWRVNRIIGEFCTKNGIIDKKILAKLPNEIKQAYEANDFNREFDIVFGVFPRADYNPKLKGKRGTRYRGVWFQEGGQSREFFHEEDFKERPIAVCRQVKVRGEVWGRSSGTLLLSSISSLNFMVGECIEVIEKMNKPPLAITSNALFGDSVLDSSSDGLTVLNSNLMKDGTKSIFPLFDVGDPSTLIQFLIPYLDGKITTAFKVDALLDFNSAKDMTATESLQRYAIRGKSLSGILLQQKTEMLVPVAKRSISVLRDMGELGINPQENPNGAHKLRAMGKGGRVIPDAVLQVMEQGLPWFELKFNNELEKLTRTEAIQNLTQIIQAVGAIAGLYPDIVRAVDWYRLLADINENLPTDSKIMLTANEFKAAIQAAGQAQQQAMALQAGQAGSEIQRNLATANKTNADAQRA